MAGPAIGIRESSVTRERSLPARSIPPQHPTVTCVLVVGVLFLDLQGLRPLN